MNSCDADLVAGGGLARTAPTVNALSLSYSELASTLATLCDVDASTIRTRFRPLRLHGFPDPVQGGADPRIRYDLPRVLAYAAFFCLADGRLPQVAARGLVQSVWPECCRAFVAAAVAAGLIRRPARMPDRASPVLRILPNGFADVPRALTVALGGDEDPPAGLPTACRVEFDCRPVLEAVASAAGNVTALATSIAGIERSFGWTPTALPFRGEVASMPPARGFLDDGPYFERALAFLDGCETTLTKTRGCYEPAAMAAACFIMRQAKATT